MQGGTDGKLGAGYKRENKGADGAVASSVEAGGAITIQKGTLGAEGALGMSMGKGKGSVTGGVIIHAGDPMKLADGKYVVHYTKTLKAGGRGGARGLEVGASVQEMEGGTRVFPDENAARAFQDGIATELPGEVDLESAQAVGAIPIGEARMSGSIVGGNVGAKAPVGPVQVGAGMSVGKNHLSMVKRVSDALVEVTAIDGSSLGGSVSAGAMGASIGGEKKSEQSRQTRVQFDLKDPGARAAYEHFVRSGETPRGANGATVLERMDSAGESDALTIEVLGAKWRDESRTSESVAMTPQGKLV